ncbi:MAG: helix-turn-helix domain-containing protein, partial [Actinomycetota bacterium]|nr:helix-turn-helix domain-containing protein [Actinomycetota bacterium]
MKEYDKYVTPRGDADHMPEVTLTKVHQGFSYLLDPTPAQRALLASHPGASRFCHNLLLGLVLTNWKENRERKEAGEEVTRESYLATRQLD